MLDRAPELLARLRTNLKAVEAYGSYWSAPNLIARLGLGSWTIEKAGDGSEAIISKDGKARVIPPADKKTYWFSLLEWSGRRDVMFVPLYAASAMRARGLKTTKQPVEYLMDPVKLAALPGGELKTYRRELNRAREVCDVELLDPTEPKTLADMLALTQMWYREAAKRTFRTYEKTQIDWLLNNWKTAIAIDPSITAAGVRAKDTGELLTFEIGSALTTDMGVSFTQRSNRAKAVGPYSGMNLLVSSHLATSLGFTRLNDGTADSPGITARKSKLAVATVEFHTVPIAKVAR